MVRIKKIVSGGQTGVDQAALQVGLDLNISIGGWCPPGKICDSGLIPEKFRLTETLNERSTSAPHIARSERTELNVRDSDGTLILSLMDNDLGTQWTVESAKKYNKSYLILSLNSENIDNQFIGYLLCINLAREKYQEIDNREDIFHINKN